MKKNQGFSLIELVVSLAILAIVGMVLVGFMSIASKTFRSINSEVNLQYESQLTVNQLKDLIVDSNRGIAYGLQTTGGAFTPIDFDVINSETLLLTALEGSDPGNIGTVKRCLMIYNEKYNASSDTYSYPVTKIVWDPVTKELLYAQHTFDTITSLETDQYLTTLPPGDYYLMSEYVEDFSVLMLNADEKDVSLTLGFENSGKTYETTPSLALRNKIIVSTDIRTIYPNIGVVRPSLINSVDIKKATVVITSDLAKVGDTVNYTASVNAQFGANDAVQWVLEDNGTYGAGVATTLSQDGTLVISQYELSTQIKVTAMSVIDNSKKATVLVTVQDGLGEFGYVNSLTIGNVITGDIAANTAPGGPYAYYGVEFQETDAYISYVNGDKLSSGEKGVTWDVTSDAPADSYSWGLYSGYPSNGLNGNCPVYVMAKYGSMGHEITVTATSKGKNYSGHNIVTQQKFTVTGLQMPIVQIEPTISLDVTGTNLSRNGKLVLTKDIQNVENLNYTLEVISTDSTGFNSHDVTKNISNVYIENTTDTNKYNLFAKTQLDWNTDFSFTVRLHVTGETNTGTPVDERIDKVITVSRVEVSMSAAKKSLTYQTDGSIISTNYLNLNVGSAGISDKPFYPEISISKIHVYNANNNDDKDLNLQSIQYNREESIIEFKSLFRDEVYYSWWWFGWHTGTDYDRLTLTFKIEDNTNTSNFILYDLPGFTMSYY